MFQFSTHACVRAAGCRCARLTLVAAAALGAAFSLAPIADVQAVKPGLNGKIAFDSTRDGNLEIYVMSNDGSGVTRLTNDAAADSNPSWSPDPTATARIAFLSGRDGNNEIYTMRADGTNQTNITNNAAADTAAAWSPDGTKIAFRSTRDAASGELYTMNADGTSVTRLTNDTFSDVQPAWSPDGTKIVFSTNRDGPPASNFEIYTVNTDGTSPTRLTNDAATDQYPTWSPDGTKIVFVSNRDGNNEMYSMNVDGSSQTRLSSNASNEREPVWSPNGQKIALSSDATGNFEIVAANPDGSGTPTNLTNNAAADTNPDVQTEQAPDTAITSGPADPTNSTSATFDFNSSETGSTFTCKLDSGVATNCTSPKTYTDLSDGPHTVEVTAIDGASIPDPTPATYTWTVDATPPETSITGQPSNPTSSTSASFSFTSSEFGSTFECKLDSGPYASCSSPKNYSGLSDGLHTFYARATDGLGNTDLTPASYTWTVDTAAPQTTIDSGPSDPTNATSATFNFSSNEPGSTFECRIDGGAYAICAPPKTYGSLGDGSHTVDIRAIDGAGNTDASPASYTWTVDTAAPQTTITSGPAHNANTTSARFEFTSTEPSSTFQCRLNAGDWANCDSPATIDVGSDGSFAYQVRAVDTAGNPDSTPATYTWTVDAAVPNTMIDSGPAEHTRSVSATFSFHASEADVAFECSLDGEDFAPCSSPESVSALVPGHHSFQVRATDSSGNVDQSPAVSSWTVDRLAPKVKVTLGAGLPNGHNYLRFKRSDLRKLSGTASDAEGLRRVKVALRITRETAAAQDTCRFISLYTGHRIKHPCKKPYTKVTGTTNWRLPIRHRVVNRLRTDEQYVLMVRATDLAGNNKYSRTRFAVVDG